MYGTKSGLAANLEMSRTTITNFFARRDVNQTKFKKICRELKLKNWQDVIEAPQQSIDQSDAIANLVAQTREAIRPFIQAQCGKMQVLDMGQSIELTGDRGIYVNVNVLEKESRLKNEREVLEEYDFDNRRARQRPIPGLRAVAKHRRLMVLGKPGAGKSTFLKYLAMQCIKGGFASGQVPFFVPLKSFAEDPKSPNLSEYLTTGLTVETIDLLLSSGRALILLDGFDEVREEHKERVLREIQVATRKSSENQFVVTCRIAAKKYTFENFTNDRSSRFRLPTNCYFC
jgi:predicted NACHT family NTPase